MTQTLEYVHGDFVFTLQATANGYESYVNVYSRRHFDNCLRNGTSPWAFLGIKVKADNGEFVFLPEFAQFMDFCEDWLTNPHAAQKWASDEIKRIGNKTTIGEFVFGTDAESEDWNRKTETHIKQLHDFPYVGYAPRTSDNSTIT